MASLMEIAQSLVRDRNTLARNIDIQGISTDGINTFTKLSKLVLSIEGDNESSEILTTKEIDVSTWENGVFNETLEDNTIIQYTVTFDEDGKPTKISNGTDNAYIKW